MIPPKMRISYLLNNDSSSISIVNTTKEDQWYKLFLPSLVNFRGIYSHILVPEKFVVPKCSSSWPQKMWGFKLGFWVKFYRKNRKKLSQTKMGELNAVNFPWCPRKSKWEEWVLPCLYTYKSLYENVDVPIRFVVPTGDTTWPRHTWGYHLGITVQSIRQGRCLSFTESHREELQELGFCWNKHYKNWRENTFPAINMYYKLHGNCEIPQKFIIPANDKWPRRLWNIKLGQIVDNIRRGRYRAYMNEYRWQLESLGFSWVCRRKRTA